MNMNHLIKMITRIFMARLMHKGINAGIDMAAKKRKPAPQRQAQAQIDHDDPDAQGAMTQQERRQARKARQAARQARQSAKLARRVTRM